MSVTTESAWEDNGQILWRKARRLHFILARDAISAVRCDP